MRGLRELRKLGAIAPLALFALAMFAPIAHAATSPQLLFDFGNGSGSSSIAGGELGLPRGVAIDPSTGDVFVSEQAISRISEFTAWGEFVKAWGWDVVASGPDEEGTGFEVCVVANGDTCKAGLDGSGAGQFAFASAQGLAVDSAGDLYVADQLNQRVQKFDPSTGPEGKGVTFLRMWGKGVNTGTGNPEICTNAGPPTDVCGVGSEGTGNGQFGALPALGSYIAVFTNGTSTTADDKVYVGDVGRIQVFNTDGEWQSSITAGIAAGEKVKSLAVDPAGNLYAAIEGKANVRKWSAGGTFLGEPDKVSEPTALGSGPEGNLYVVYGGEKPKLAGFAPGGTMLFGEADDLGEEPLDGSTGIAVSAGGTIYVANSLQADSFVRAYGNEPPPPPPSVAPQILVQQAASVASGGAIVRARIAPHFWITDYHVEYGTSPCEAGGCTSTTPSATLPDKRITSNVSVSLEGLTPGQRYYFRFVAESEGGGPVYGLDPDGEGSGEASFEEGLEGSFTTYLPPTVDQSCPNAALRTAAAASLPDCRAYEMVSPVDKNGVDADSFFYEGFAASEYFGLDRATPQGEKLTFSAAAAFSDPLSSPFVSQYIASRGAGGWQNRAINPPERGGVIGGLPALVENEYKAFSPDLRYGWLVTESGLHPLGDPSPVPGHRNLYRRDDSSGTFTWLQSSGEEPEHEKLFPELQGLSADGGCAVYRVNDALVPEAPSGLSETTYQTYLRCEGEPLRLVSVLPSGEALKATSTAGSETAEGPVGFAFGSRIDTVEHALSADGSKVYWSAASGFATKLYLRVNADRAQSKVEGGKCSEPGMACTVQVSPNGNKAQFWTANPAGTRAIYSIPLGTLEGNLYEYAYDEEAGAGASTLIAPETLGVAGASEDLSRVYLASEALCAGEEENGAGQKAQAGEANLYLYERGESCAAGEMQFLGRLDPEEVKAIGPGQGPNPISPVPFDHVSRASADGSHLVFVSAAKLTAYDNTDAASGKADREVYLYDAAGGGRLTCVSCNPSGAAPRGADLGTGSAVRWTAAWIPGYQSQLYGRRPLSGDGKRLFFNSIDPLSLKDANGVQDVYQWEAAGSGRCETTSPSYSAQSEGCVDLISSGQSGKASEFVEASESGDDVFFRTESSLVLEDPGLVDIYDARVGGGFPLAEEPPACEGDACQGVPSQPEPTQGASATFHGPGNPKPGGRCPRGKRKVHRKGKVRCVRKRHHRHRGAHHERRAGR
jgi:NHL repeat